MWKRVWQRGRTSLWKIPLKANSHTPNCSPDCTLSVMCPKDLDSVISIWITERDGILFIHGGLPSYRIPTVSPWIHLKVISHGHRKAVSEQSSACANWNIVVCGWHVDRPNAPRTFGSFQLTRRVSQTLLYWYVTLYSALSSYHWPVINDTCH